MFGYVRPLQDDMKDEEYDLYRSVYCGLCRNLGERYGQAARLGLNYDYVFLAMLLSESETVTCDYKRCIVKPVKKHSYCHSDAALDMAADINVILTYWNLMDDGADEKFFGAASARAAALLMRSAYKKAADNLPEFVSAVRENLERLAELEREGCTSLDKTADTFASVMRAAALGISDTARRRVLEQVFYHTGRLAYVLDAVDDLEDDFSSGKYNPLIGRFGLREGKLDDDMKHQLSVTIMHSLTMMGTAFQLLLPGPWSDILSNIIYKGIPAAAAGSLYGSVAQDANQPQNGAVK